MTLEKAANLAFIVACVALVSIGVAERVIPAEPGRAIQGIAKGQSLDVPGLNRGATRTVLVAVSSTCRFCTESMEFYRRLTAQERRFPEAIRIAFMSREPLDTLRDYLVQHKVEASATLEVPASFSVTGTPALFLLDPDARVIDGWLGRLHPDQEEDVWQALTASANPGGAGNDLP